MLKCVKEFSVDTGLCDDRASLCKTTLRNSGKCMYLKFEMFCMSVYIENKSDCIEPWACPYTTFQHLENPYEEN